MAHDEIDLGVFNSQASAPAAPTPNLPPAGHERDELLKRRTDELEQRAEEIAATNEVGTIPEKVFRPDREIRAAITRNYLDIGTDHPYLKVKWVNYVNQHGTMIWQAKADGWRVATSKEFPEAADLVREDNTIRVGDVMLMCIEMDRHLMLEQREARKRQRQQYGVEAEIHDLADRTNRKHRQRVFAGVSTPEIGTTGSVSPLAARKLESLERASVARDASPIRAEAARQVGNMLKNGTVPGLPIK